MPHTYAILDVSPVVYATVRDALSAAGYQHAFHQTNEGEVIDMHGIAIAANPKLIQTDPCVDTLITALRAIIACESRFSLDPLEHAQLAVEHCQATARTALERLP